MRSIVAVHGFQALFRCVLFLSAPFYFCDVAEEERICLLSKAALPAHVCSCCTACFKEQDSRRNDAAASLASCPALLRFDKIPFSRCNYGDFWSACVPAVLLDSARCAVVFPLRTQLPQLYIGSPHQEAPVTNVNVAHSASAATQTRAGTCDKCVTLRGQM